MEDEGFSIEHLAIVLAISDGDNVSYIKNKEQAIETRNACDKFIEYLDEIDASTH